MPLSSFIEFRQSFANGMVALDVPGNSLEDILGKLIVFNYLFRRYYIIISKYNEIVTKLN